MVNLTAPNTEAPPLVHAHELPDRALRDQYRWAVDHFAKTFFRDWTTTSLHYELRWLDGDILPPCPDKLMVDRKVSREEITREIARRAVYNDRPDPGEALVSEMSQHALKLLKQGRYQEAAAVFEFGVHQRPEDPGVRNNLGFCLIPVEARDALMHLKAAANMGYGDTATNTYNQMCCYVEMGRSRAALNIAETEARLPDHPANEVLLWKRSSNKWELITSNRPFECVARLAVEISRGEGWKDQEQYWSSMVDK